MSRCQDWFAPLPSPLLKILFFNIYVMWTGIDVFFASTLNRRAVDIGISVNREDTYSYQCFSLGL